MRNDVTSSHDILSGKVYTSLPAASSTQTSAVKGGEYAGGVSFGIQVASVAAGGVLTVTLQNSPDNSTWTNESDDNNTYNDGNDIGNEVSKTITAAGLYTFQVPNPRFAYFRLNFAATVNTVAFSAFYVGYRRDSSV